MGATGNGTTYKVILKDWSEIDLFVPEHEDLDIALQERFLGFVDCEIDMVYEMETDE